MVNNTSFNGNFLKMRGKREHEEEEVVYNLIPPEKIRYEKSPRYTSKFKSKVEEDINKTKSAHKTMGFPSIPLAEPSKYLQKQSRIVPPRPEIEGPRCLAIFKKPQLPPNPLKLQRENSRNKRNDENSRNKRNEENKTDNSTDGKKKHVGAARSANYFRVRNILNVQHSKPPQRELKIADTCKGDRQSLLLSGLAPYYLYKKDYGRPPKYLIQQRKEAENQITTENQQQEGVICIKGNARKELLKELKEKWNQLQTAFQQLPMMIDTIPKIKKKINLEKELMDLEKDIALMEKYPELYLCDDDHYK